MWSDIHQRRNLLVILLFLIHNAMQDAPDCNCPDPEAEKELLVEWAEQGAGEVEYVNWMPELTYSTSPEH